MFLFKTAKAVYTIDRSESPQAVSDLVQKDIAVATEKLIRRKNLLLAFRLKQAFVDEDGNRDYAAYLKAIKDLE